MNQKEIRCYTPTGFGQYAEGLGTNSNASGRNAPLVLILNDQGGAVMNISCDVASTLRAQDHGHPPLIFDAR